MTLRLVVPGLARVRGRSMEPTLRDGDLLLVLWGGRPRIGGLVIVDLPADDSGQQRPTSVKRFTRLDPQDPSRLWVERDNPAQGVDSWLVGSVRVSDVRARVLGRISRGPVA